jgi:hypothetical protein
MRAGRSDRIKREVHAGLVGRRLALVEIAEHDDGLTAVGEVVDDFPDSRGLPSAAFPATPRTGT